MSAPDAPASWELHPSDGPHAAPPPHRPVRVEGLWGYVDPLGVRPGERLRVQVSAPAAHRIALQRLGRTALLDPDAGDKEDRAEAVELAALDRPASPQVVQPGSYAWVDDASLARPQAISAWVRPWRLPAVEEVWAWAAIVGDLDAPEGGHWVLAIDDLGRPGLYLGDDGGYDRAGWTFADASLADRLGAWIHLACAIGPAGVRLYVDGVLAAQRADVPQARRGEGGRLRIAAGVDGGLVDRFLDADLSALTLMARPLDPLESRRLAEDRGLSDPEALGLDEILAHWPLREAAGERLADVSGSERHATLVNGGTLGIPGPSASTASGRPGYEPARDPLRGGAVRFACDDLLDCGWPSAAEVTIPVDADSGAYCVRVALAGAEEALEIPFVVVRPVPRRARSVALLHATFTWTAYARRPADELVVPGLASSFYTRHLNGRLFFRLGMRMPLPRARPYRPATHLRAATLHQHLVRPERFAEAWLAREGYAYECVTDVELDREPELLDRFAALMIVGHNEYWTQGMRDAVAAYLAGGGAVVNLSGNTLFWRVSLDPEAMTIEARKTSHPGEADPWLGPDEWGERWHADGRPGGTWSLLGEPASALLGLDTLGWIDSADAASFAPFTVQTPDHFLFREPERVPLEDGRQLGTRGLNGPAASGYEMDGLPEAIGMPSAHPGDGRTLLAHADGQHYVERFTEAPTYGADMLYWERADGGRVFNAGSIAYTGSLAVDPGLQALTRNVLHHFGVEGACA